MHIFCILSDILPLLHNTICAIMPYFAYFVDYRLKSLYSLRQQNPPQDLVEGMIYIFYLISSQIGYHPGPDARTALCLVDCDCFVDGTTGTSIFTTSIA